MMGRIHCEGCGGDFTAADGVTASHLCPALLAAQASNDQLLRVQETLAGSVTINAQEAAEAITRAETAEARLTELSAELEKRRVSEAKAWDEVAALRDMSGNWQAAENRADAAQSRLTRIEEAAQAYINAEHFVHNMLARDRSWPDEQEAMRSAWAQRKRTLKELKAALDTPSTPGEG